ncbi:cobalamin-dependent protein [Dehalobacter sp. DCM]|uniref:cobalamin B12-binding domain-containing protein n=1 Tax=Dehalobacter sp. DCM TaxID=2907827 RepID=UPI0030813B48|nr:cobalamin-dependent protein [Dehalobacter sp. DCM]
MFDVDHITEAFLNLDEVKVFDALSNFMSTDPSEEYAQKAVEACQQGMAMVGERYEHNTYFLGDLIYAGDLLATAIEMLKPAFGSRECERKGVIVLGTVAGDIHSVGKDIFRSLAEAAGFIVWDLGIDQESHKFIAKVNELRNIGTNTIIVGMSGVLTLALESMKTTVEALGAAGLRNQVKVIVGGTPLTAEAFEWIGADAYTTSAAEGLKICRKWVECRI